MPESNEIRLQKGLEGDKETETKAVSSLVDEGQIPCIIVHSDRKHVEYIYNIIDPIAEGLRKKGFRVKSLSCETPPDEHFGETFEELAEECALGVVIFDGFRPNVLYEYGLLRGKNKPVILIQDKCATVAIKSFYSISEGSNKDVIKDKTSLTETKFNNLKEPPVGHFSHLSDRHGINVIEVDYCAHSGSPEHPKNKIENELTKKLMRQIVEKYSEQSLKSIPEDGPNLEKFHTLVLKISEYYAGIKPFTVKDIESAINEVKKLEDSSGSNLPPQTYSTIASLYTSLAKKTGWKNVREIIDYYNKAIGIYEGVLEFGPDPTLESETQKKIGDVYWKLSQYQDRAKNCKNAIKAYEESLKVRTFERFPMDYAMTQNNLGNAYRTLAEVENKAKNCKNAIKAYEESLKVRTFERFPMDYAMTQNNLGNAYRTLAEVENKAKNCKNAIKALEESLKVHTLKRFPMQYATTQNNLGVAHRTLAEVESKAKNCKNAIKACEESLKVYTLERFPMDYAGTQNNLGVAHRTLAEVESKAKNCKNAIKACEESLKVFTEEEFPEIYQSVERNLRKTLDFCGDG